MPTTYKPKPPVTCFNCQDSMVKRRTSKSGRYYCPKPECQAERHADWQRDRSDIRVRELQDKLDDYVATTAKFIVDVRNGSATCSKCGLADAPTGWAHPTAEDGSCDGLGVHKGRIYAPVVFAAFGPAAERIYHEVKR